jgi:hypothetical protein
MKLEPFLYSEPSEEVSKAAEAKWMEYRHEKLEGLPQYWKLYHKKGKNPHCGC